MTIQHLSSVSVQSQVSISTFHRSFKPLALGLMVGLAGMTAAINPIASFAVGFSGAFAPANWTETNNNANGYYDPTNAPNALTLIGGNNGSGLPGTTDFTIVAPTSGTVSFNWGYGNSDGRPSFDGLVRLLNGGETILALDTNSGSDSFTVVAGDVFGFRIFTTDNLNGSGGATFTEFSTPSAVPFEFNPALGLVVLGVGFGGKRLLKNHLNKKAKRS